MNKVLIGVKLHSGIFENEIVVFWARLFIFYCNILQLANV